MTDDPPSEHGGLSPKTACYRALILDQSRPVLAMTAISAANDDIAVEVAQSMVNGHAVELWDGVRFIEHFPPVD